MAYSVEDGKAAMAHAWRMPLTFSNKEGLVTLQGMAWYLCPGTSKMVFPWVPKLPDHRQVTAHKDFTNVFTYQTSIGRRIKRRCQPVPKLAVLAVGATWKEPVPSSLCVLFLSFSCWIISTQSNRTRHTASAINPQRWDFEKQIYQSPCSEHRALLFHPMLSWNFTKQMILPPFHLLKIIWTSLK